MLFGVISSCSRMMSAKNGGVQTNPSFKNWPPPPPPPCNKQIINFLTPFTKPPNVTSVLFWHVILHKSFKDKVLSAQKFYCGPSPPIVRENILLNSYLSNKKLICQTKQKLADSPPPPLVVSHHMWNAPYHYKHGQICFPNNKFVRLNIPMVNTNTVCFFFSKWSSVNGP